MKKIVSFDKNLEFKSMIGEISSISLDHDLKFIDGNNINGNLLISGSYRLTEASRLEDKFEYKIPVEVFINETLDKEDATIEIEDFKYHIENDDTLVCHIDMKIEGVEVINIEEQIEIVEEKPIIEKLEFEPKNINLVRECDGDISTPEKREEISIENIEEQEEFEQTSEESDSPVGLFSKLRDEDETYSTYSVYIIREHDTIETIKKKYNVDLEELQNYNDLNNMNIGSKIIIPTVKNET